MSRTVDEPKSSQARRMSSDQKWAIGLTVFYLVLTTTRAFDFWNESAGSYSDSWKGNILISLLGNLLLLLIIPFLAKNFENVKQKLMQNWHLVLFFGYTLISCLWSEFPGIAFRRWVKIFIYLVLIINTVSLPDPAKLFKKIFLYYIYIVSALSLIMILASRQYGWQSYQGGALPCGIIGHKNGFGLFCAAAFFTLLWCSWSGDTSFKLSIKKHIALYLALLAGLIASGSKTPLGGMLLASGVSLIIYLIIKLRLNDQLGLASIGLLLIAVVLFGYIVNANVLHANLMQLLIEPTGKDLTFTGRTDIWSASINLGLKNNPAFGSGFGALFVGEKSSWLQSIYGWKVGSAHNGYIETFLETGFVGLAMFLLVLAKILGFVLSAVCKYQSHPISLLSLTLLGIFVNFFEVNVLGTSFLFFLIIWLSVQKSMAGSLKISQGLAAEL